MILMIIIIAARCDTAARSIPDWTPGMLVCVMCKCLDRKQPSGQQVS